MRDRVVLIAGWASGALALLVAAGGAASAPSGWRLGVPGGAALVACALGLAGILVVAGGGAGRLLLAVAPVLLLVLFGVPLPGVAPWAGPPLAILVLAAVVAALAGAPFRRSAAAF